MKTASATSPSTSSLQLQPANCYTAAELVVTCLLHRRGALRCSLGACWRLNYKCFQREINRKTCSVFPPTPTCTHTQMPPSNAFVPIKQELLGKVKESGEGGANQDAALWEKCLCFCALTRRERSCSSGGVGGRDGGEEQMRRTSERERGRSKRQSGRSPGTQEASSSHLIIRRQQAASAQRV